MTVTSHVFTADFEDFSRSACMPTNPLSAKRTLVIGGGPFATTATRLWTPVAPLRLRPRELSHLGLPIAVGLVESRGVASLHRTITAAAYPKAYTKRVGSQFATYADDQLDFMDWRGQPRCRIGVLCQR